MFEDVDVTTNWCGGGCDLNEIHNKLCWQFRKGYNLIAPPIQHNCKSLHYYTKSSFHRNVLSNVRCIGGAHRSGFYAQTQDGFYHVINQLDVDITVTQSHFFSNVKIVQIASSYSHTLALTDTGRVYVWGSSGANVPALGLGDDYRECPVPTQIEGLPFIRRIFSGNSSCFSFAVTPCGDVFAWGRNSSCQLGLGDGRHRSKPELLESLGRVSCMTSGDAQVFAVDASGLMFSWGLNYPNGILGYNSAVEMVSRPNEVVSMRRLDIQDVFYTNRSVLALSRSCKIYGWDVKESEGRCKMFSEIKLMNNYIVRGLMCGTNNAVVTVQDGEVEKMYVVGAYEDTPNVGDSYSDQHPYIKTLTKKNNNEQYLVGRYCTYLLDSE
ncbi:E3 ubiquitin-protein ligase HERC [Acrasis kona]|uniref:E3 ubiquitin-protein ligase HERC n=1 Tax=Acrasis kona TaxID=1008807 RepID=A0AAW2ZCD0_9EUKA